MFGAGRDAAGVARRTRIFSKLDAGRFPRIDYIVSALAASLEPDAGAG